MSTRAAHCSALTRERVVEAAAALVDEHGVSGLSMRQLARRLDAAPSTLYWHVQDREHLLALVLEHALAGVTVPASGSWDERLVALLEQCRAVLMSRPTLVPVILGARWNVGRHALTIADETLRLLVLGGVDDEFLADAYFLLLHYTCGAIEAAAFARWNETFAVEHAASGRSFIDGADLADFPNLSRHGPATSPSDMDTRFRYGLTTVLAGLSPHDSDRRQRAQRVRKR